MNTERIVMRNESTTISPSLPICDTDIFKWLSRQWHVSSLPFSTKGAIIAAYLNGKCGFDVTKHSLHSDDLESLMLCVQNWFEVTAWFPPQPPGELFNKFISPQKRDFIKIEDVTECLKELTKQTGWIYGARLDNANTYYQIKGNKVYVKAQQILASRYLCDIREV